MKKAGRAAILDTVSSWSHSSDLGRVSVGSGAIPRAECVTPAAEGGGDCPGSGPTWEIWKVLSLAALVGQLLSCGDQPTTQSSGECNKHGLQELAKGWSCMPGG